MSEKPYTTSKATFLAFFFMLFGASLMVLLVLTFNKDVAQKEVVVKNEVRHIAAPKTQQKVSKPKPRPKPKPKNTQPKAPVPNLNSTLGGVAMDIPEFQTQDIMGDATQLLKDVTQESIMNENTVDVKPKVSSRPPLHYPQEALSKGIKGYVIINLLIAKDGSVEIAKILDAQPSGIFDKAALSAVEQWRFSPARYKGKSVKIWVKQKISFQ